MRLTRTRHLLAAAALVAAANSTPAADDPAEAALRRFFEGQRVVVLLDMPASSSGIDIYPEREYPLDFAKTSDRVRGSGVSLREGDRTAVTRVKVKDDLIEFQLGGGGFSNFRDSTANASTTPTSKSSRERDLERRIREEKDPARKRDLQRDLDYERRERERRDDYNRRRDAEINERRREQDRDRALDMGSRFNVRFEKKDVPAAFKTPEGIMRALEKYVDFGSLGPRPPQRPEDLVSDAPPGTVKKGMSRREVEAIFGAPQRDDQSKEGALELRVAAYERGRERIEVTYVDDVVIRVETLASRP